MKTILLISLLLFSLACNSRPMALASLGQSGGDAIKVWVNTSTGVYHCPGSQWYGKTKEGAYMGQKEAQGKKLRPAYGKVCQ